MDKLKNPVFIANSTDPLNGKFVKKIYVKKISKLNRVIWPMEWEYYSDRAKNSITDLYKQNVGKEAKVIYSGEPQPSIFIIPSLKPQESIDDKSPDTIDQ